MLVRGYRPGALDALGLDASRRASLCHGLIDVSLDAYGWTGPWRHRRGFDSLVQMSCGIADAGMRRLGRDGPKPLPVQALDHATGYLMAAAVVRGLTERLRMGVGCTCRRSLARNAALLAGITQDRQTPLAPVTANDLADGVEETPWGAARRVRPPCAVDGTPMGWHTPATELGSARLLAPIAACRSARRLLRSGGRQRLSSLPVGPDLTSCLRRGVRPRVRGCFPWAEPLPVRRRRRSRNGSTRVL